MNKPKLLLELLALAENPDGPEGWIHACLTAAEEAAVAIAESDLVTPSQIAQAIRHIEGVDGLSIRGWQVANLVALGRAYAAGTLRQHEQGSGAAAAYRNNLPPMKNRKQVQAFVACIAVGVLRGYIPTRDANVLLYGAQAALSAFPKRRPSKGRKQN